MWTGDDLFDVGAGLANTSAQRVQRVGRRSDDASLDRQHLTRHAERIGNALAVIDHIAQRFDVNEGKLRRRRGLHRVVDSVFDIAMRDRGAFHARRATNDAR